MSPIRLHLSGTKILLKVSDSKYDPYALNIAGRVKNEEIGQFEYSMSVQNLERIFSVFDGVKLPKPDVVEGQHWLEKMRQKLRNYRNRKSQLQDIMKVDRYPIEPNGKFVPYAHQTKIVAANLVDPFVPTFSDCGTGKTGSLARAMEILIAQKEVRSGKIIVSAPLSILQTSWLDDIRKFTNLTCKILWTPIANKVKRVGEKVQIGMNAEKPEGTLSVKRRKGQRFVRGNEIKEELNIFDEADGGWTKMEVSWTEAVLMDGSKVPFGPIYGVQTERLNTRLEWMQSALQDPSVDVFLINHDGVRIYKDLLREMNFDWFVVDESTKIKSMASQVTQAHVDVSWNCKRRTIMTGTPNPNGFVDLWSQYYFLDRGLTLGTTLKDYLKEYFTPIHVGNFGGQDAVKWELSGRDSRDRLIEKVKQSAVFFSQEDCLDLPPRTDLRREVYMTAEQSRVYKKMEKELAVEFVNQKTGKSVEAEAVNTLSKLMKLRQITSGYVSAEGEIASIEHFDKNPKLIELDAFIEELQGKKLVIACQFKEEIRTLLERYKALGIGAVYGDETVDSRNAYIREFQTGNKLQIMVLQPQAAGHGITLTEAHYFAFLSLDYNFEYYYQVGKRIQRLGQKNSMFVYHMLARTDSGDETIDHDLMEILKGKSSDRDVLFDAARNNVEIAETLRNRLIQRVQENT